MKTKLFEILSNPNDKLIAVDLDGTLCEWAFWETEPCKPIEKMIGYVNSLYKQWAHIVIYTARDPQYFEKTQHWLVENGVMFHWIAMMRKIGADVYIDDRAINVSDILEQLF